MEGGADGGTELHILVTGGIVGDDVHLLDIGVAIVIEALLVTEHVNDLGHEIVARVAVLVDLLLHAALHGHGEVGEQGGVDIGGLLDVPAGLGHLVGVLLGADDAHKVGGHHGLDGGKGHGERVVDGQVVGRGMGGERDDD